MLTALVICLTAVYALERLLPLLRAQSARLVRQTEAALMPVPRQEQVGLPSDLFGLALSYGEEWAQEDALKRMRELYAETGSWDMVRVQFGLSEK